MQRVYSLEYITLKGTKGCTSYNLSFFSEDTESQRNDFSREQRVSGRIAQIFQKSLVNVFCPVRFVMDMSHTIYYVYKYTIRLTLGKRS